MSAASGGNGNPRDVTAAVPLWGGPPPVFRAKKKPPPELSLEAQIELENEVEDLAAALDPSLDDVLALARSPLPDLKEARRILALAERSEKGWWVSWPTKPWKKQPRPKKSERKHPPINVIFEARQRLVAFRAEHPGPVKLKVYPASGLVLDREGHPVREGESLLAAIETVHTAAPRKKRRAAASVAPSLTASAKPPRRSLRVRWRGLRRP